MELGKHQGSHCKDYNTHISQWQVPFQQVTSRQAAVRARIRCHFLSPLWSHCHHHFHNPASHDQSLVSTCSQTTSSDQCGILCTLPRVLSRWSASSERQQHKQPRGRRDPLILRKRAAVHHPFLGLTLSLTEPSGMHGGTLPGCQLLWQSPLMVKKLTSGLNWVSALLTPRATKGQ